MKLIRSALISFLVLASTSFVAVAQERVRTPSAEGAEVYIISPQDGDTVGETFTVLFG